MELYHLYHPEIPDFLRRAAHTPPMLRLKQVGMNCGCEYTSFDTFREIGAYTRWEHSLGVALIVWHFTHDAAQTLAGLFHDIATPTFAHVIDFLHGDHLTQESTEDGTKALIENSPEIQAILRELGLETEDVCDYHRYPIADNDSPRLSADRLEYTLGNLMNYGFAPEEALSVFYHDLTVVTAEDGQPEIAFQTPSVAHDFAMAAMKNARVYVCDADRYSMQTLALLLCDAIHAGVLDEALLYTTEPQVIAALTGDFADRWKRFRSLSRMLSSDKPQGEGWLRIPAKKRCLDPLVGSHRASALFPDFAADLQAFLNEPQTQWLRGVEAPTE